MVLPLKRRHERSKGRKKDTKVRSNEREETGLELACRWRDYQWRDVTWHDVEPSSRRDAQGWDGCLRSYHPHQSSPSCCLYHVPLQDHQPGDRWVQKYFIFRFLNTVAHTMAQSYLGELRDDNFLVEELILLTPHRCTIGTPFWNYELVVLISYRHIHSLSFLLNWTWRFNETGITFY